MFVDLHLHADGIRDADLATLAYFGVKAAVTCARDAGAGSAAELRRHWDELLEVETERLRLAGIRPMVALALHPASIPWHGADDLLHRLPGYFDDPRVVALGELGLQEGGEREEEIFSRQLGLAARMRKPVIVHTPSREKLARTRRLLTLVQDSPVDPARVLIDHVDADTFTLTRALGCWAGLTLQPGLFEPAEAAALIRARPGRDRAHQRHRRRGHRFARAAEGGGGAQGRRPERRAAPARARGRTARFPHGRPDGQAPLVCVFLHLPKPADPQGSSLDRRGPVPEREGLPGWEGAALSAIRRGRWGKHRSPGERPREGDCWLLSRL